MVAGCSQSLKLQPLWIKAHLSFIYIYGFIVSIKVHDLVDFFFGCLPPPPHCVLFPKSGVRVKDGRKKLLTAVFGVNEMAEPPVDPLKGREKDEGDGTDLLIRWAGRGPRTESHLCCPGWNFVLEKSLTFLNPNCAQWGVSSFPLPSTAQLWSRGLEPGFGDFGGELIG